MSEVLERPEDEAGPGQLGRVLGLFKHAPNASTAAANGPFRHYLDIGTAACTPAASTAAAFV